MIPGKLYSDWSVIAFFVKYWCMVMSRNNIESNDVMQSHSDKCQKVFK